MAPLGTGGITNLTVTINKLIDSTKVSFDYLVFRDQKEFMEDEVLKLGAKKQVIDLSKIHNPVKRFFTKMNGMKILFKRENYDVVHVDASTPYDVVVAIAAKLAGIKVIVLHAHNDSYKKGRSVKDLLMPVFKQLMLINCTDYFAISESAARFMLPNKILKNKKYRVVRNAIIPEKYAYNPEMASEERKRLGIKDNVFVLGNIGRFVYQKNHEFMIEVFSAMHRMHENTVLLLVGEGELEPVIKEKVKTMNLSGSVIFYGITHDVQLPLNVMDAFIFPSHFEGLGIVAIEAQTTGLPVWCAETISEEAKICENFHYINGWKAETWANEIWKVNKLRDRRSYIVEAKNCGYDMNIVSQEMQDFYLERVRGRINDIKV